MFGDVLDRKQFTINPPFLVKNFDFSFLVLFAKSGLEITFGDFLVEIVLIEK